MYLLPFAALAMASCSSSEDVAQNVQTPSQELKFFPAVEGTTRGAVESNASISKFHVYADGDLKKTVVAAENDSYTAAWQAVTKVGTVWTPQTPMWWATDAEATATKAAGTEAKATFTAFANALSDPDTEMESATNGKLVNVIVPTDLSKQKDLVVAYNTGKRTDFIGGVPLHFRHALSQIIVNATYNNAADVSTDDYSELAIKVKSIKFVGLANKGTLNLPTVSTAAGNTYDPVWTSVDGAEEFAAAPATEATLASAAKFIDDSEADNPLLLMPQQKTATTSLKDGETNGAYLMVEVDINKKDGVTDVYPQEGYTGNGGTGYAWIAVPVKIEWNGGYKYTYTLNFSNIACGKVSPKNDTAPSGYAFGDDVIKNVPYPVNFLVTVEDVWGDGGTETPSL